MLLQDFPLPPLIKSCLHPWIMYNKIIISGEDMLHLLLTMRLSKPHGKHYKHVSTIYKPFYNFLLFFHS